MGLFSPFRFALKDYEKYDITKFKDHIRFLEMVINRDGEMGGLCPLFFDGAVCQFDELPKPENTAELQKVYSYIQSLNNNNNILMFSYTIKELKRKFKNIFNFIYKFKNKDG